MDTASDFRAKVRGFEPVMAGSRSLCLPPMFQVETLTVRNGLVLVFIPMSTSVIVLKPAYSSKLHKQYRELQETLKFESSSIIRVLVTK